MWNALLPSFPVPTHPSKCNQTSALCHTDAIPCLCRCPRGSRHGSACRFGFVPAGSLSPRLAPVGREQWPQGKGCRRPPWQGSGSDVRPPLARALLFAANLPFLWAHPLPFPLGPAAKHHRLGCSNNRFIYLLTVLEAGRPRRSSFLLRCLSLCPHGASTPCGSES